MLLIPVVLGRGQGEGDFESSEVEKSLHRTLSRPTDGSRNYPALAKCFSISSSTVNGFLVFCDRCIRPS
jgi:hypothetical protein